MRTLLLPALAIPALLASCGTRDSSSSDIMVAAECSSSNANARTMAMIQGLCGCPSGSSSCDRTFSNQSGYIVAGQKGCSSAQAAELAQNGSWTHPIANGAGNAYNWGGGGTAAGGGHEGWDYLVANGTEIRAVGKGTVVYALKSCNAGDSFCGNAWGNHVVIHHGGKLYTRYAHMAKNVAVSVGQAVNPGQRLGEVGSTGASDAPHLHFEIDYAPAGWYPSTNPRNGACVADPGRMNYSGGSSTSTPSTAERRAASVGKRCKVSPNTNGVTDQYANVRDQAGNLLVQLTNSHEVKIRGWVGEKASIEVNANGKDYGAHVGTAAFLAASQINLGACR